MPKTLDTRNDTARDDRLHVSTKSEIIAALQCDNSRGGLQLEWILDRCNTRKGPA